MFSKNFISLLVISFIGFIDWVGIGLVYPMFSSMLFQEGSQFIAPETSDTARGVYLGLLLAMMPLTQFLSAPLLGMLSDRHGRKKVIIPSLLVGLAGYLLAVFAAMQGNLFLLMLSRIGVGISAGTASVVHAALADYSTPEDKAKNFGILNMALGLGFTVGPLLGGFFSGIDLGFISGYPVTFLAAAGMILINLLSVIFFFEERYAPKEVSNFSLVQGIVNIQKAFVIGKLRFVYIAVFFACCGWSFYWEFTPVTWIKEFHFDNVAIGQCYAYGAIFYALSSGVLIRPIVSRFPIGQILIYALFGCAFAIGILLVHTDKFWLWIYIPLQQFAMALFWPTAAAVVSNAVSEEEQGETLGILGSVDALAFAVSPLMAGPLLGLGNYMPIVIGSGAMLIAAGILKISFCKKSTQFVE